MKLRNGSEREEISELFLLICRKSASPVTTSQVSGFSSLMLVCGSGGPVDIALLLVYPGLVFDRDMPDISQYDQGGAWQFLKRIAIVQSVGRMSEFEENNAHTYPRQYT